MSDPIHLPKLQTPADRAKRAIREAPAMTTVEEIERRVCREIGEATGDGKHTVARQALHDIYDLEQRYKKELSALAEKYRRIVHSTAPDEHQS